MCIWIQCLFQSKLCNARMRCFGTILHNPLQLSPVRTVKRPSVCKDQRPFSHGANIPLFGHKYYAGALPAPNETGKKVPWQVPTHFTRAVEHAYTLTGASPRKDKAMDTATEKPTPRHRQGHLTDLEHGNKGARMQKSAGH